jgi:iron complex outermembrane receptor protein
MGDQRERRAVVGGNFRRILLSTVAAISCHGVAAAQGVMTREDAAAPAAIQEVVVTARRVKENIQAVPETVTALSGKQLIERNVTAPSDLQFSVPSLTVQGQFGHLSGYYTVRGLSTGVITYFNEAPGGPTQVGMPFFDLSSTQVLNGPQGTLFGRSGAAGAVLITPQRPNLDRYQAVADVSAGDYGRIQSTLVGNLPIVQDQLALRVAYHHDHIDGYTSVIGSNTKLDEQNSDSLRVGLEWKPGHFDNYLVYDFIHVDQTPAAEVLAGGDPNLSIFNLPPAFGPLVFGSVCNQAVHLGLSPSAPTCIAQRLGILANIKSTLVGELNRVSTGGNAAVRKTLGSSDLPAFERLTHQDVIDVAQYDFGNLGLTSLGLKNVFSYQTDTAISSFSVDGIGGLDEESMAVPTTVQLNSPSAQQVGNHVVGHEGPAVRTITEEIQAHGGIDNDVIRWTTGFYYQNVQQPTNLSGVPNAYKLFGGVLQPGLGYNAGFGFQNGGSSNESAGYGQVTLDLSKLGVHGLQITGGYRETWDNQLSKTFAADPNPAGIGPFIPGLASSQSYSSHGTNYTLSIEEQINHDLHVYFTTGQGYVPGGINVDTTTTQPPNFTPTYSSEIVKNYEIGAKWDFRYRDLAGRLNVDAYRDDFTNIQEQFTAQIGGQSAVYVENVAAARMQGIEAHLELNLGKSWGLTANYSYVDAQFVNWVGTDPFNQSLASDHCLPGSQSGFCLLNLKNNPFPFSPTNQFSATLRYQVPIDPRIGELTFLVTGYYQTREWLTNGGQRLVQIGSADGLGDLTPTVTQPAFGTMNLRLQLEHIGGRDLSVALFANNVTDTTYALSSTAQPFSLGIITKIYAPPRMVGLNLTWRYGD